MAAVRLGRVLGITHVEEALHDALVVVELAVFDAIRPCTTKVSTRA
jgi:hypothetical protein